MNNAGGLVALLIVVGAIWWTIQQGRAGAIGFEVDRPGREIVTAALQTFSQRGWVTTSQTEQSATFSRSQAPGCL